MNGSYTGGQVGDTFFMASNVTRPLALSVVSNAPTRAFPSWLPSNPSTTTRLTTFERIPFQNHSSRHQHAAAVSSCNWFYCPGISSRGQLRNSYEGGSGRVSSSNRAIRVAKERVGRG